MKQLAPIGIGTYTRVAHLRRTVEALRANSLAPQSDLYIFSDAPRPGDEKAVAEVRSYLRTIDGFRSVHIVERQTNGRVANNRGGLASLLEQFGYCIFMEDDIVTAPGFLTFMNHALQHYKDTSEVFSVTGYTPPIKLPDNLTKDYFTLRRFNGWGLGIWKDRFEQVPAAIDPADFDAFSNDPGRLGQFAKNGVDMLSMLRREVAREIDAYDVKAMFHQYRSGQVTVYPRHSLVQNTGHDGSGVHCGRTERFHHEQLWEKQDGFHFDDALEPDRAIVQANYAFRFTFNSDAKMFIIENLLRKIVNLNQPQVSLWGIGEITGILLPRLQKHGIRISRFIDSKAADTEIHFQGQRVVTIDDALQQGVQTIVITSWGCRHEMYTQAIERCRIYAKSPLIIMPEALPPE